ncbi:MAG TPA: hypothetical protein VE442_03180 [Jatrophihabitans sp.]|jgi:hypothetical protein|nr:hypothetical protein [Jatrophihabitans sp.]
MDSLAIMTIASNGAVTSDALSALPNAPVVEIDERDRVTIRARAAAAVGLRRLADAVAPPPWATVCASGQ